MVAFNVKDDMPSPDSINTIEAQLIYKSTFYGTWSETLAKVGFTGYK